MARTAETACGSPIHPIISKPNDVQRTRIINGGPELESELKVGNKNKMSATFIAINGIIFRHDSLLT
ncbi:MAG: hypothetical protein ACREDA_02885, partial [Methylocella sp.]